MRTVSWRLRNREDHFPDPRFPPRDNKPLNGVNDFLQVPIKNLKSQADHLKAPIIPVANGKRGLPERERAGGIPIVLPAGRY